MGDLYVGPGGEVWRARKEQCGCTALSTLGDQQDRPSRNSKNTLRIQEGAVAVSARPGTISLS